MERREFPIEVVASAIELFYLTNDIASIYEFYSYVLGKEINNPVEIIKNKNELYETLKQQYPKLRKTIYLPAGASLTEKYIKEIIDEYKKNFSETIKISPKLQDEIKTHSI